MTITYRTAGPWGAGLGADLSALQIDNSFWDLHGRVTILEAWPTPAAIDDFIIDELTGQMTVLMDDATTLGPYQLPVYVPSAFTWAPGLNVTPGMMFSINSTIYTVIYPHLTVDPFDPAENDGGGNDYYQEFISVDGVLPAGGAAGMTLVKSTSADYDVTWSFAVVPTAGTTGQVLKKLSDVDYDHAWADNNINDLSDVVSTIPSENDVLLWSASDAIWYNAPLTAANVTSVPSGSLAAITVQAALDELGSEKVAVADIGVTVQAYDVQLSSLIRQVSAAYSFSLDLTHIGKHILHPASDSASPRTYTIPANSTVAFPIGTAVTFVNEANTITISISSDTLVLAGTGSTGSRTLAADGIATALKIATTKWIISGSGLT